MSNGDRSACRLLSWDETRPGANRSHSEEDRASRERRQSTSRPPDRLDVPDDARTPTATTPARPPCTSLLQRPRVDPASSRTPHPGRTTPVLLPPAGAWVAGARLARELLMTLLRETTASRSDTPASHVAVASCTPSQEVTPDLGAECAIRDMRNAASPDRRPAPVRAGACHSPPRWSSLPRRPRSPGSRGSASGCHRRAISMSSRPWALRSLFTVRPWPTLPRGQAQGPALARASSPASRHRSLEGNCGGSPPRRPHPPESRKASSW